MPGFLAAKPRLHMRHVFGAANPMADVCGRGRLQELYALCAGLGVHPKRLQVPPDVSAFLNPLVPEHKAFNLDLLPLPCDPEVHPGPSGGLAAVADALRDARPMIPSHAHIRHLLPHPSTLLLTTSFSLHPRHGNLSRLSPMQRRTQSLLSPRPPRLRTASHPPLHRRLTHMTTYPSSRGTMSI
eukprot:2266974-Pleurochrysis_carterae.AAC.3